MKNKKAAFEMSITTIVILVIAVIMLILGLVFVRTIMCRAIFMVSSTTEGAQKEIEKLFAGQGGEVNCMGTGTSLATVVPGRPNVIACGFSAPQQGSYAYQFDVESHIPGVTAQEIKQYWIVGSLQGSAPGIPGQTTYLDFVIKPPKEAPEGWITIRATGGKVIFTPTGQGGQGQAREIAMRDMRFEIKSLGWMRETVC
ncbi:MAG: hypothetical protein ACPLXC_03570 [Candidatus Pacearchaeota archaeon]